MVELEVVVGVVGVSHDVEVSGGAFYGYACCVGLADELLADGLRVVGLFAFEVACRGDGVDVDGEEWWCECGVE